MTKDQALQKIKKCLALGRSATEHEAAAAMRQAQKLMELFNLREQDVSLADVNEVKVKASSTAANVWELRLVGLIAEAFGCETFGQLSGKYNDAGTFVRARHWVFVGIDSAPTVAGYACEVLVRQCVKARLVHIGRQPKNCKPITKTARGDAFAIGWVSAVRGMVERFAQPATDKALLLAYIDANHGELKTGKARDTSKARKTDVGHFIAGRHAGEKAELHRGVGGLQKQGLLA